jgi:hypothetical protein
MPNMKHSQKKATSSTPSTPSSTSSKDQLSQKGQQSPPAQSSTSSPSSTVLDRFLHGGSVETHMDVLDENIERFHDLQEQYEELASTVRTLPDSLHPEILVG